MLKSLNLITPVWNDAPEPWQWAFQDGASPSFEGIVELHDQIMFYLVVIAFGVAWMLSSVILNFGSNKNKIVYKYHNHGIKCHFTKNNFYMFKRNYTTKNFNKIDNVVDYKIDLNYNKSIKLMINTTIQNIPLSIPWVETKAIKDSKMVLNDILKYLESFKDNKVLEFLMNNIKVQELMKDNPTVYVNGIDNSFVATHCMSANLSFKYKDLKNKSGVYLFIHPESGMCYIGSAVSLRQRLKDYIAIVQKSIRNNTFVNEFYSNIVKLEGFNNMVFGILLTEDNLLSKFTIDYPYYCLNLNEVDILVTFTQWLIRVQELCLINYLNLSLNKDAVKFLTQWKPKDLINYKNKRKVYVYDLNTNYLLTSSIFKKRLAILLGISYNTFIAHLNHLTPIWSPRFERLIILRTKARRSFYPSRY